MGQITKEFAERMVAAADNLQHTPTTCHEQKQLAQAWLRLHEQSGPERDGARLDLTLFVNAASIDGSDYPHQVVQKLQAALDAANVRALKNTAPQASPSVAPAVHVGPAEPVSEAGKDDGR